MSCLCREGEKQCGWWIAARPNNKSGGDCANPHIGIQTKSTCGGTQEKLFTGMAVKFPPPQPAPVLTMSAGNG